MVILGCSVGSTTAWLRQRIERICRERIEVASSRLLELRSEARREIDRGRLNVMVGEVDDLAGSITAACLEQIHRAAGAGVANVAIETGYSTVARALIGAAGPVS